MINFLEVFKTSLIALGSNKIRSALTMLGVIIGVAAVILLISIGRGVQNYITDQFDALGSNLLFVSPGKTDFRQDPSTQLARNKLAAKHVDLIERYASDFIVEVTPYITAGVQVEYKNKSFYAAINATDEKGGEIFNFEVALGRMYTANEVNSSAKVVLIGSQVAEELFGKSSPLGQRIKFDSGESFLVIGVLQPKGRGFDDAISIPYTTAMEVFELRNYSSIVAKADLNQDIDRSMRKVKIALLRDLKENEFTVLSQADILSSIQNILGILTAGLGAIAAISLIVGGIGIMNIMLVSVTERTREIGLRKAIGATPLDILSQFLIEAILLSTGGGIIGITLGWLLSLIGRTWIRTEVPFWAVALAFSFAAFVGIIFGTYPAYTASKKDPIEALRYE